MDNHNSFGRSDLSASVESSKQSICTICLEGLRTGRGHAIFTAQCSHAFHFNCIASSVGHGNQGCPVCRSQWDDIPIRQLPPPPPTIANVLPPLQQPQVQLPDFARLPFTPSTFLDRSTPVFSHRREPSIYSDDEPLLNNPTNRYQDNNDTWSWRRYDDDHPFPSPPLGITIQSHTEYPALSSSASSSSFAVLLSFIAPPLHDGDSDNETTSQQAVGRASIDLVLVLDVSGSMSGQKLALLKQAVAFVVRNLSPSDRLSIVTFSSIARRIYPLRRMSNSGQDGAVEVVESLMASGGTNITEGVKKGVRVLSERREKNPVASIMLLSDGIDNFNFDMTVLPSSSALVAPVHTFGFGLDHDSALLHTISDATDGTFSFIESVEVVQEAFARCIGGLLSVVAKDIQITLSSASEGVQIASIRSGRYRKHIERGYRKGRIDVGLLYAEERKQFLVFLKVPECRRGRNRVFETGKAEEETATETETPLLDVRCAHKDPISNQLVTVEGDTIKIRRPHVLSSSDMVVSVEVDQERNRLLMVEDMMQARSLADMGDLEGAQSLLGERRSRIIGSPNSPMSDSFGVELDEMSRMMGSAELYQRVGRGFTLSGLSSHSAQRATTRTRSTMMPFGSAFTQPSVSAPSTAADCYETPTMARMVKRNSNRK